MNFKNLFRGVSLLVLLVSLIPVNHIAIAAPVTVPPADMFQLPWDQGLAWYAIDGIDNGIKRPISSSHNYAIGGAVDFAPRTNMKTGDDTSNFWVTAAAAGTVVEISSCHMKIAHSGGWITEYQFLGNIQVKLGDAVARNQRIGIIADGVKYRYCSGFVEPNIPHLHFMLRPTMIGATFAGWQINYSSFFNRTTFTKNGNTVGLFQPLLNTMDLQTTSTPTLVQPTNTPRNTPSPTPTLSGPYVSTVINPQSIPVGGMALVAVSLNSVPTEGYTSAEFTCTFNANLFEVSNVIVTPLFGSDAVAAINGPQAQSLIVAIAGSNGNKATTSGSAFTFNIRGLQEGQTVIECRARVSQGNNVLTELPFAVDYVTILGNTPTPNLTPSPTPTLPPPTATSGSTFTVTPVPTQTPIAGWLTFTDSTFGFQFQYPPQGQIQADSNDSNTRINELPIVQPGTNLTHKFMDVLVGQNVTECKSSQTQDQGVTVTINGIPFLKQTGSQGAAGSLFQLVEYSTLRDGVCVNLEFVLQSHDPNSFATPRPAFDYATETALFDQIIGTYMWLASMPTDTPTPFATFTPTPAESLTPTFTPTVTVTSPPVASSTFTPLPTVTPVSGATLNGRVIASKVVTVRVYDLNENFVAVVNANPDGTFSLSIPAGSFTVVATANGFLRIQGSITLTDGGTRSMPVITLLAGDIDDNNAVDQFDAMTIGFNYNTAEPPGADLNSDGIINVLDLELLAQNYRKTGPVVWE